MRFFVVFGNCFTSFLTRFSQKTGAITCPKYFFEGWMELFYLDTQVGQNVSFLIKFLKDEFEK